MCNDIEADSAAVTHRKQQLRTSLLLARRRLPDKPIRSRQICDALVELPEYRNADSLSTYIATPAEVHTRELINRAWSEGKTVAIPCCIGAELQLFHFSSWEQVEPRTMGILEPSEHLRKDRRHWLNPSRIDLFVVPGIAFDRCGGRLGYGKGYYDRLLGRVPTDVPKVAPAFSCQIVDQVPMTPYDVAMDYVISEDAIFPGTT